MKEAEAAIARAAADRGEDVPAKKTKTNSKKAPKKTDEKKDDKNIRRRFRDPSNSWTPPPKLSERFAFGLYSRRSSD